eukprot:8067989-Pyramimonas_sp.AAC.1
MRTAAVSGRRQHGRVWAGDGGGGVEDATARIQSAPGLCKHARLDSHAGQAGVNPTSHVGVGGFELASFQRRNTRNGSEAAPRGSRQGADRAPRGTHEGSP